MLRASAPPEFVNSKSIEIVVPAFGRRRQTETRSVRLERQFGNSLHPPQLGP